MSDHVTLNDVVQDILDRLEGVEKSATKPSGVPWAKFEALNARVTVLEQASRPKLSSEPPPALILPPSDPSAQ